MIRNVLIAFILIVILSACNGGGAVVFEPTPLPPEQQFVRFQHPNNAFEIEVPALWAVYTQNTSQLATAYFTLPQMDTPSLSVAVIQQAEAPAPETLSSVVADYQSFARPDVNRYSEQERQQLPDGSWRVTGIRRSVGGLPETVNTFLINQGAMVAVAEVVVPQDPQLQQQLQRAINTISLNPTANLTVTDLITLSAAIPSPLTVTSAESWSTAEGIYFVSGEIANNSPQTIAPITVSVRLLDANGNTTAEANDTTMGYGIAPGKFAPFSLRFGQGLPRGTTDYTLTMGDGAWRNQELPTQLLGSEQLNWQSRSAVTPQGHLVIEGTVTNIGTDTASELLAITTVFDANQRVIAAAFAPVEVGQLASGETAPFIIRVQEMGGDPANFIVEVQGKTAAD